MAGFTFNITDMSAMMNAKDVVTKKIVELVKTNPKVCYINSDGTGHSGPIRDIYEQYPDRVLDVGIAEMNLVTVAAAMAKKGYIPFGQTFGPFLCVRALYPRRNFFRLRPNPQYHCGIRHHELHSQYDHDCAL